MIFGPIKLVIKIVTLFITVVVLYFAVTFVQIWMRGHDHATGSAQAILVFGTTQDNCRPSVELQDRLDEALVLYRAGRAPIIAVTGSNQPGDRCTEAGVSAQYLVQHGVPKRALVVGGGKDTWQNVSSVVPALKTLNATTVFTVTDPFHEYRAMATASAQGLRPLSEPTTTSPIRGTDQWSHYLRETLEVGVGRIVGLHTLSNWLHG